MLNLKNISKSFGDTQVLINVSLGLNNEVVALIGANGTGKTTLLRIMLGELQPDDGQIIARNVSIGYVPQHAQFGRTIAESFGADIEQWRIDIALQDVAIDKALNFETSELSGGQKTRLSIARVLAQNPKPSILLLDEPTNNLDIEGQSWLIEFVNKFMGSVVIVSHDRNFINKTCGKILELKSSKLWIYKGNYDDYKHQKETELKSELANYQLRFDEKKRLEELLKQKTKQMTKVSDEKFDKIKHESKSAFHGKKSSAQANTGKQIKALISRIEHTGDVKRPDSDKRYPVELDGESHSSRLILRLEKVTFGFIPKLKELTFEIRGNERLRISGPNGVGKTTLLKAVVGLASPNTGKISLGTNVSIGYLSQEIDGLDHAQTALKNLESTSANLKGIYREAHALGLSDSDLKKKPHELSQGQQTKLGFVKLLLSRHDLLVLDEPTNHLDIPTREAIESALQDFKGAMLVATHDEYFIEAISVTDNLNLSS